MASLKSPGLVLKKTAFSETSLILKVFTRDSGLVTLIAKGAKRPHSKFRGVLDFFVLNEFLYSDRSKSEILTLTDAALIRDFPRLKGDPAKQSLANVFLEVYLKYMHGPEQALPQFELLLEHLDGLEGEVESPSERALRLCDFLLGLCAVSGFSPQFIRCVQCGRPVSALPMRMDHGLGGPVCVSCEGGEGGPVFRGKTLQWLGRVQEQGMRAGHVTRNEEAQAGTFLLAFVGEHAGGARPLKSLEFYRQMTGGG